ncbi:MAG: endonuclease VIII [Pseudomonadota bacterium]
MPEGPEIRQAADKIAQIIESKTVEHVEVGLTSLKPFVSKLKGRKVTEVQTHGKSMITHFDNDLSIYSHNQLYGIWMTSKRGHYPNTNRQLRLALHTASDSALLYSASDISVWHKEDLHKHPLLRKLGPDIMDTTLQVDDILVRLSSDKFKNRALASLYLDQQFLAGVGNYLRSEILFAAGINPTLKPKQLNDAQLRALAAATLSVARQSYNTGGYTISDERLDKIDTNTADYESERFMVFDRDTLPCRTCSTHIQRATLNARRIYWCPSCQPI